MITEGNKVHADALECFEKLDECLESTPQLKQEAEAFDILAKKALEEKENSDVWYVKEVWSAVFRWACDRKKEAVLMRLLEG